MPKPILIIKTGSTLPGLSARKGDFEDWISTRMGKQYTFQVIDVTTGTNLPESENFAGTVITGSPCMVTAHLPWSEMTARWLAKAVDAGLLVLGICYGHQLLAYALGGEVGDNPRGSEYGTTTITPLGSAFDDTLFKPMSSDFLAQVCHKQTVLILPPGAKLLALSSKDSCQAFVFKSAWGVQFHPEFDAEVMHYYISHFRQVLIDEGQDADELSAQVRETPVSAALLQNFASICSAYR